MECKFCKKILSSANSLKTHQQKVKYCLKLQGNVNIKGSFSCNFCNKDFFTKYAIKKHEQICKKKIEQEQEVTAYKTVLE